MTSTKVSIFWQRQRVILVSCLGGGLIALLSLLIYMTGSKVLPLSRIADFFFKQSKSLSTDQLQEEAKAITVRVLSSNTWGSGILLCKAGQSYTVLTAEHVLGTKDSYQVETSSGQIYSAHRLNSIHVGNNDIGFLEFQSRQTSLQVAVLGDASATAPGESVYATGFAFEANPVHPINFMITEGEVSLLPSQSFQNGYQIGYTNHVKQGMSGGALLNRQGQVIGMNGMDKYPLWGNPYIFQDGSIPPASVREQMRRLSWAIPMQQVLHLISNSVSSSTTSTSNLPCIPRVEH